MRTFTYQKKKFFWFWYYYFFLQIFVFPGLGVNVNFLGWWILQIGLSVACQLFDLYCLFPFWLLFGMYKCILLFLFLSTGDKNEAPIQIAKLLQRSISSFVFVFLHTKLWRVLGYYLTIQQSMSHSMFVCLTHSL